MMQFMIDADATAKWASFSGDFNPIHFDLAAARAAGSQQLIAHGMNALLAAKRAFDDRGASGNGWHRFNALLRKPIAQGRHITVNLRPRMNDMAFVLCDGADECIKGSGCAIDAPSAKTLDPSCVRFDIETGHQQRKRLEFEADFPFAMRPWIFLDALVFSSCLGDAPTRTAIGLDRLQAPGRQDLVMQISHRVTFDAGAIDRLFANAHWPPPLAFSVSRPEPITSGGDMFGTVSVTTLADDRAVLEQEIGLLSRTAPRFATSDQPLP